MALEIGVVNVGVPILNDIINNFVTNVDTITISAIAIAIYAIVIWHYYRTLAKRDLFHIDKKEGGGIGTKILNFLEGFEFLVKYIIFYPLLSFIFFGIFSTMMFMLSKETIPLILLTSVSIISATRITAYYNEDLARDLAKLVPFALLGVLIIQSDFLTIDLLIERMTALPNFFIDIASFILYFLLLEISLRLLYGLKKIVFNSKGISRRDKIELETKVKEIEKKQKIEQKEAAREYIQQIRNQN